VGVRGGRRGPGGQHDEGRGEPDTGTAGERRAAGGPTCHDVARLGRCARRPRAAPGARCPVGTLAAVWRRRLSLLVLAGVALAACGGASASSTTTTTTARTAGFTYGPNPSVSARMICRDEAVEDITHVLGVAPVRDPVPTWHAHRYTCPYVYRDGRMVLSVQELPTLALTRAYVRASARRLGDTTTVSGVGQGAFTTRDGSVISRKDNKVLTVDVAGLPAMFGKPSTTRAEVALTVTEIIFACWRGD
jgi:hypothetical protein